MRSTLGKQQLSSNRRQLKSSVESDPLGHHFPSTGQELTSKSFLLRLLLLLWVGLFFLLFPVGWCCHPSLGGVALAPLLLGGAVLWVELLFLLSLLGAAAWPPSSWCGVAFLPLLWSRRTFPGCLVTVRLWTHYEHRERFWWSCWIWAAVVSLIVLIYEIYALPRAIPLVISLSAWPACFFRVLRSHHHTKGDCSRFRWETTAESYCFWKVLQLHFWQQVQKYESLWKYFLLCILSLSKTVKYRSNIPSSFSKLTLRSTIILRITLFANPGRAIPSEVRGKFFLRRGNLWTCERSSDATPMSRPRLAAFGLVAWAWFPWPKKQTTHTAHEVPQDTLKNWRVDHFCTLRTIDCLVAIGAALDRWACAHSSVVILSDVACGIFANQVKPMSKHVELTFVFTSSRLSVPVPSRALDADVTTLGRCHTILYVSAPPRLVPVQDTVLPTPRKGFQITARGSVDARRKRISKIKTCFCVSAPSPLVHSLFTLYFWPIFENVTNFFFTTMFEVSVSFCCRKWRCRRLCDTTSGELRQGEDFWVHAQSCDFDHVPKMCPKTSSGLFFTPDGVSGSFPKDIETRRKWRKAAKKRRQETMRSQQTMKKQKKKIAAQISEGQLKHLIHDRHRRSHWHGWNWKKKKMDWIHKKKHRRSQGKDGKRKDSMLEQDSPKTKWKLALRIATSPSDRWLRKAADCNPDLSTRYWINRAIGRPRKRWEDDINELRSNIAWEDRLGWFETSHGCRNFDRIDGEPMEFEWNIFTGFNTLQLSEEVKRLLLRLGETRENFTGRIIFMSMFNDISWRSKDNEKECLANAKLVSLYAKRFGKGQWSFIGPGSEKKWYCISEDSPQGVWDNMAERMLLEFAESGHPIFRATSPLSRGRLKSKGHGK